MYMLRNLYILNFLPFRPIRVCLKKMGPGDLMKMIGAMKMKMMSVMRHPTMPPMMSRTRL